jgi:hypothetical protein
MKKKGASEKIKDLNQFDQKKLNRKIIAFFLILCFVLYGKSISNGFSMDDEFVILNNAQVHKGIKAIPEIFKTTYVIDSQKSSYEYRPLVKVSYAIEYQLWGESPHISHLINIIIYFLNALLLWILLKKLFSNYHYIFPLLATTIFIIHPAHSEVVLSLKNRDVMFSFFFALSSLYLFIKFADEVKWKYAALGFLCMVLALLSKKDSLPFIAAIPFTLYFFKKISLKRILPMAGLIFLTLVVFHFMAAGVHNKHVRNMFAFESPLFFGTSLFERIPMVFYCVFFYLKLFVLPYPLISYYGVNQIEIIHWNSPMLWFSILIIGVLLWFAIKGFKERKIESFAIFYFFICISMFTNIVPVVGIVAERFEYIASVGLCIVFSWFLLIVFKIQYTNLSVKFSAINNKFYIFMILLGIIFSGEVIARCPNWKTNFSLYETDVKIATESAHLHSLYAAACIQKASNSPNISMQAKKTLIENAVMHYQESIRIIPDYITSLNNLGMAEITYYQNFSGAEQLLLKAVKLDTNYVQAYFNLALTKLGMKDTLSAETNLKKAIFHDDRFFPSYRILSNLYLAKNDHEAVKALNLNAIEKGIISDVLFINMANMCMKNKDTTAAVSYLEKALAVNSDNSNIVKFVGDYYTMKGDFTKANYYYNIKPNKVQK